MWSVETFVLRLWKPSANEVAPNADRVAGLAIHPRSGDECTFDGAESLLRFLRDRLAPTERSSEWEAHESDSGHWR